MGLLDLRFSDLFVGAEPSSSWFKATPDSRVMIDIPPEHAGEVAALRRALVEKARGTGGFSVEWGEVERRERLRIKPLVTAHVDPLFVCRRFSGQPRPLQALGFPPQIVDRILGRPVQDGLILFMGSMGDGKTTAASCFTVEYVARHGGVAVTVESPIEMELEGRHGTGVVYQTEVESEDAMAAELRGMLRSSANLLFCGEVKTDGAAREVLMLATSGHPVVTTFHAPDLLTGLARFCRATGDQRDALADALTAVFHLRLRNFDQAATDLLPPGELPGRPAPPTRLLTVSPLLLIPENRDAVRSNVRAGGFHQLSSEIERQRRLFLSGGLP